MITETRHAGSVREIAEIAGRLLPARLGTFWQDNMAISLTVLKADDSGKFFSACTRTSVPKLPRYARQADRWTVARFSDCRTTAVEYGWPSRTPLLSSAPDSATIGPAAGRARCLAADSDRLLFRRSRPGSGLLARSRSALLFFMTTPCFFRLPSARPCASSGFARPSTTASLRVLWCPCTCRPLIDLVRSPLRPPAALVRTNPSPFATPRALLSNG